MKNVNGINITHKEFCKLLKGATKSKGKSVSDKEFFEYINQKYNTKIPHNAKILYNIDGKTCGRVCIVY